MKGLSTRSLLAAVLSDVSALACHIQLCQPYNSMVVTGSKRSERDEAKILLCFLLCLLPSKFHALVSYKQLTAGTVKLVP